MNFQSYKDHLSARHPEEDSKDRREYGQSCLFGGVRKKSNEAEVRKSNEAEAGLAEGVGVCVDTMEMEAEQEESSEVDRSRVFHDTDDEDNTTETVQQETVQQETADMDDNEDDDDDDDEGGVVEQELEDKEEAMVKATDITRAILELVEYDGGNVDLDDCTTEEEKLNKCLLVMKRRLNLKKEASSLVTLLEDLKLAEGRGGDRKTEDKKMDNNIIITCAKTIEDLTEIEVFTLEGANGRQVLRCLICDVRIKTNQQFRAVKQSVKRHLVLPSHVQKEIQSERDREREERWESRNRRIGRTIGGLVYHLIHNGRPDGDLPVLIHWVKVGGGDVGNINHSHNLVAKLLPDIANTVKSRLQKFLGSIVPATGCLPPCNIMADKATDKRDSRHLIGILTINPGGTSLLKAFFLGAPKCAGGKGEVLANSIVAVSNEFIAKEQYRGFSGDGVYINTGAGKLLNRHFGRPGIIVHDLMHKAALTDTKMRNPDARDTVAGHKERFAWLNTNTDHWRFCGVHTVGI